jgi:cbb3-type cytochrome oxidase subunit 3
VVSFVIFFSIFCFALIYVWKARREHIDHMAAMPLTDELNANDSQRHDR